MSQLRSLLPDDIDVEDVISNLRCVITDSVQASSKVSAEEDITEFPLSKISISITPDPPLEVQAPHIRVIHTSFSDFITSSTRCKESRFLLDDTKMSDILSEACLLCMIQSFATTSTLKPKSQYGRLNEGLAYSVANWSIHLEDAVAFSEDLRGAITTFTKMTIVPWSQYLRSAFVNVKSRRAYGVHGSLHDVAEYVSPRFRAPALFDELIEHAPTEYMYSEDLATAVHAANRGTDLRARGRIKRVLDNIVQNVPTEVYIGAHKFVKPLLHRALDEVFGPKVEATRILHTRYCALNAARIAVVLLNMLGASASDFNELAILLEHPVVDSSRFIHTVVQTIKNFTPPPLVKGGLLPHIVGALLSTKLTVILSFHLLDIMDIRAGLDMDHVAIAVDKFCLSLMNLFDHQGSEALASDLYCIYYTHIRASSSITGPYLLRKYHAKLWEAEPTPFIYAAPERSRSSLSPEDAHRVQSFGHGDEELPESQTVTVPPPDERAFLEGFIPPMDDNQMIKRPAPGDPLLREVSMLSQSLTTAPHATHPIPSPVELSEAEFDGFRSRHHYADSPRSSSQRLPMGFAAGPYFYFAPSAPQLPNYPSAGQPEALPVLDLEQANDIDYVPVAVDRSSPSVGRNHRPVLPHPYGAPLQTQLPLPNGTPPSSPNELSQSAMLPERPSAVSHMPQFPNLIVSTSRFRDYAASSSVRSTLELAYLSVPDDSLCSKWRSAPNPFRALQGYLEPIYGDVEKLEPLLQSNTERESYAAGHQQNVALCFWTALLRHMISTLGSLPGTGLLNSQLAVTPTIAASHAVEYLNSHPETTSDVMVASPFIIPYVFKLLAIPIDATIDGNKVLEADVESLKSVTRTCGELRQLVQAMEDLLKVEEEPTTPAGRAIQAVEALSKFEFLQLIQAVEYLLKSEDEAYGSGISEVSSIETVETLSQIDPSERGLPKIDDVSAPEIPSVRGVESHSTILSLVPISGSSRAMLVLITVLVMGISASIFTFM